MASPFLVRRFLVGTSLAAASVVSACGSRGPLDITIVEAPPADAATDAHADASADASEAGDGAADAIHDALEAAPDTSMGFDGGPLINCGACLVQSCGTQLLTCITAAGCTTALQCVASTCLTGGTPNFTCLTGCTNGDATTQQQLLSVLGCVIGTCGMQCTSVLTGIGGGLGGGGGGG